MGLLVPKLDSCLHFSPPEELVSVHVRVLYIFLLEKQEQELSCFWAGIAFPHTTPPVLPGQHKLLDGLWLPPFSMTSLKAHCAWGSNQPCIPRKYQCCHFVSMDSAWTRSATLAVSPMQLADTGTANLCDSMFRGSIIPVSIT